MMRSELAFAKRSAQPSSSAAPGRSGSSCHAGGATSGAPAGCLIASGFSPFLNVATAGMIPLGFR